MNSLVDKYFAAIRHLIPSNESGSSVGLDIGKSSCKLVELSRKGDSYELISWAVLPVENGDVESCIKSIMGKLLNPTTTPSTAVSGKGTLIRYIDMPKMSLADLKKSFAFEADKYFPFQQDQIFTDCFILDDSDKGSRVDVLVSAVKKEIINERLSLLSKAGLQGEFVGLNSIAIANVINELGVKTEAEEKGNDIVAILDIGEMVSDITIMVNRVPRFSRDIFIGGRDFTKAISTALGVSFEEAEKLKCEPKDKLKKIVEACETTINNLVSELRLSCDYFVTEKNLPIAQILVTGGASQMVGLPEELEKNLELKVSRWNPLDTIELSDNVSADEIKKHAGQLGVALGLALYQ